jgi:hypothetical protein
MKDKRQRNVVIAAIAGILLLCVSGFLILRALQPTAKAYMGVFGRGGLCSNGQICQSETEYYYDKKIKEVVDKIDFPSLPERSEDKVDCVGIDCISATLYSSQCLSSIDAADTIVMFPYKYGDTKFVLCQIQLPDEFINLLKDMDIPTK